MLVLKVKGSDNLVRDPKTGAILAEDTSEFRAHRRRKNIIKKQKEEIETLKQKLAEVDSLKKDIEFLKQAYGKIR